MTSPTIPAPRLPGAAVVIAAAWLGLAILAGTSGFLLRMNYPGPQLLILSLFTATLASATSIPAFRAWVDAVPLRVLIGVNGIRFIGIAFLVLAARGQIAPAFAQPAGWGDIATAAIAIALVLSGTPATPVRRTLVHLWNVLGFLDLLAAVATATWVTLNGITPGVRPVLSWPFSAVPLFFVPLFLANHILIVRRLLAPRSE
jgi:hypothetical protein